MLLPWTEKLNIGVPEIDSEHKYLITLVNGLHDKYCEGTFEADLAGAFLHLTNYTSRHFRNEEALMKVAGYPALKQHAREHELLSDQLSDLTEAFVSGNKNLSEDTMLFLRDWLLDHVMVQDMKIGTFVESHELPTSWGHTPAFSDSSSEYFKKCSLCGKIWGSFDGLAGDASKSVLGCMLDEINPLYNLVLFNCECRTTLVVSLFDVLAGKERAFSFSENRGTGPRPSYCLRSEEATTACPPRCACLYTRDLWKALEDGTPLADVS